LDECSIHPEFAKDIQHFETEYREISEGLAERFRADVDAAIESIQRAPERSGHFLQTGSQVVREFRRRNLVNFPFFVLYGLVGDTLIFGSVIPSRSDPVTWLTRFGRSS
jgi:hypothetical protein